LRENFSLLGIAVVSVSQRKRRSQQKGGNDVKATLTRGQPSSTLFTAMSLLFPTMRTAVRTSVLARRPPIATPLIRTRRFLPPSALAPLSILPTARSYATKQQPHSGDPSSPPENTTTNNPPTQTKDTLSGDVPIAPGGILAKLAGESASASRDLEAAPESGGRGGGGVGLPPKIEDYISSADRKRERLTRVFYWGALLAFIAGSIYLGRPIEEKEKEQQPGWHNVSNTNTPHLISIIAGCIDGGVVTGRTFSFGILEKISNADESYDWGTFRSSLPPAT